MNTRPTYTTDLSDSEWKIIALLIAGQKERGCKIKYDRREVLNAIFYLNRNGCHWRDLPHDFPPYRTVSHYFHTWRRTELWQTINDTLRTDLRVAEGRDPQPSAGCMDSQSVKTTEITLNLAFSSTSVTNLWLKKMRDNGHLLYKDSIPRSFRLPGQIVSFPD